MIFQRHDSYTHKIGITDLTLYSLVSSQHHPLSRHDEVHQMYTKLVDKHEDSSINHHDGEKEYDFMRDQREGRSPHSRRMYMESKEMHSDKATQMRELENYM